METEYEEPIVEGVRSKRSKRKKTDKDVKKENSLEDWANIIIKKDEK